MKTFPTQLISHPAAALKQSATRTAIKQLLTSALIVLIFTAGLALSALRIAAGGMATEAPPKPKKIELARLSEEVTVHAAGRGNPWINLIDGRELITPYSGPIELTQVLEQNQARPLSLCSADYDEDGVPDLISGYAGPDGGIVTLLRGNVDSIYPNAPEAQQRRAEGTFTDAPFLSPAFVFGVPEAVDFIGAGDFDGDSHWDVVAAARGSNKLYLLSGNGQGGFAEARAIDLPGTVTAMVTGEINRQDGLDDVVVGVGEPNGAKVLVFEGPKGALKSKPESFTLLAQPTSLALGRLDNMHGMDLAISAGRELVIVHGRDRKSSLSTAGQGDVPQASISKRSFPFRLKSVAVGDFAGSTTDVALLSDEGTVYLLKGTEAKHSAKTAGKALKEWESGVLISRAFPKATNIVRASVSCLSTDVLIAVDPANHRLHNLNRERGASISDQNASTFDVEGEPVAVLPMRLNKDALSDLVILRTGESEVSVLMTAPHSVFTVTTTADNGDNGNPTPGSLRQAILQANANPGADEITFSIGSGLKTITPPVLLPNIFDALTIDGTTQPGFAGKPIIELNGSAGFPSIVDDGLLISAGSSIVRGLIINQFRIVIWLEANGGNIIEGNFIGTDNTGTASIHIGIGVQITSGNNTIGGTTTTARNIISGSDSRAIDVVGPGARGNQVQGNFIGTDVTGTSPLGNRNGVLVTQALDTVIGGLATGAQNVISASANDGLFGIALGILNQGQLGGGGTTVQGNNIGTDVTGTSPLGNGQFGILVEVESVQNRIEGNLIAFNLAGGIRIPNVSSNPGTPGFRINIRSNSIHSNGGLGIDLAEPGVNPNDDKDPDTGANLLQNFPELTSAISSSSAFASDSFTAAATSATITSHFNSIPNSTFTLEFFFGGNCGGAGEQFVGSIPVKLGEMQISTDANGNSIPDPFTFSFQPPGAVSTGFVNCTATDSTGNTSEFSQCIQIVGSCSYQLSSPTSPSFAASGGTATVVVTTPADCSWTSSSNAPWIRITSSDSTGIGTVRYSVDANTGILRTGTMTIAGQAFTVTQSGLDTGPCSPVCPANQDTLATSSSGALVSYTTPSPPTGCSGVTVACSPPSGSTFPIGTTTVACTASDGSAIRGACSFSVTVTAPAITDAFRDKKKLVVVGLDFGPGAELRVNDAKQKKTSNDSGNPTTRLIAKKSGKTIKPGDRIQVINAGGVASNVFIFCTPVCPANQTAVATSSGGAVVAYSTPTAQSGCSGVNETCSPASGSTFAIGTATVTCTASSGSVLSSTCTFTVTVTPSAAPLTNVMRDRNSLKVGESPQRATNRRPKHKTPD